MEEVRPKELEAKASRERGKNAGSSPVVSLGLGDWTVT